MNKNTSKLDVKLVGVICLIVTLSSLSLPVASAGVWDPYYSKDTRINQWKTLFSSEGGTYEVIGYSVKGKPIYAFYCGNTLGGKVLWISEIHGSEDNGERIVYNLAKWLLTSESTDARSILSKNRVCFVPIVDVDVFKRGNANYASSSYGVNLNRNFVKGWSATSTSNDNYSGKSPASEPETQVIRNILTKFKPAHFTDVHVGAGPYAAYYRSSTSSLVNEIKSTIQQKKGSVTPYTITSMGSNGFAMGDAYTLGADTAWLVEAVGSSEAWRHTSDLLLKMETYYMPKIRLLFIAQCMACS